MLKNIFILENRWVNIQLFFSKKSISSQYRVPAGTCIEDMRISLIAKETHIIQYQFYMRPQIKRELVLIISYSKYISSTQHYLAK